MKAISDEELLQALVDNPETGMRQVVDHYGGRLLGRLRSYAEERSYGNADADDVWQRAFLRLLDSSHREALREAGGEILPWLTKWGYWRLDDAARGRADTLPDDLKSPTSPRESQASERVIAVRHALQLLSPRDRSVLRMRYEERLTSEEAGARLGISPGAAKKAAHDARGRLRKLLVTEGIFADKGG